METRELRYFVALAEELHFARAAARVGIAQSPLSKAITEMERRLGVQLFIRTRRSTQLTFVGETLLSDARRILMSVDQARQNLLSAAAGRRGRLRIALCDGLAHHRIAKLLSDSREREPAVDFQFTHAASSTCLQDLRSGVADMVFTFAPIRDSELISIPIWQDAVVMAARSVHPVSGLPCTKQIDVSGGPVLFLGPQPQGSADPFDGWQWAENPPKNVEYVASTELLLTRVASGYGTGFISAAHAETIHRSDVAMRLLQIPGALITTFLLTRGEHPSILVRRFADRARKIV
jgi:DNA-binding transcriptional LysR family regulator